MPANLNGQVLRLYRGLPGSGKTTDARKWVAEDPTARARVNRDDLRAMLHGGYVDGPTEHRQVTTARDNLIRSLLQAGVSVTNDDTNLPQKVARGIAEIAWALNVPVEVIDLTDVPLGVCLERDRNRIATVGENVIRGMHDRFLAGGRTLEPLTPHERGSVETRYRYEPDATLPQAWMVDIDGTLALMSDRGPFDWHRVNEDTLNQGVADLVRRLENDHLIVMSGRDECCRADTEEWLWRHGIDYTDLFMRAEGDTRKDAVVKLELFRNHVAPRFQVLGVLDDRNAVVDMWRDIGLFCAQVAPGDF